MDQQAKKHLQEEFDAALEEKDQMITVLQTQVRQHTCQPLHILSRIKVGNMFRTPAYRNCAILQLVTYVPELHPLLPPNVSETQEVIGEIIIIIILKAPCQQLIFNERFLCVPTGCSFEKTDEGHF